MKEINTSQALAQLRMSAAMAGVGSVQPEAAVQGGDFSKLLQQSIDKVNELQQQSGDISKSFELGDPNIRLAEVMIARQKASVAFESVVQVRNKLVSAYNEIMSMQV